MNKETQADEPKFYEDYNTVSKSVYQSIDEIVSNVGWKGFVLMVLEYQRKSVKSNYKLLKSWK